METEAWTKCNSEKHINDFYKYYAKCKEDKRKSV